jgi:hypothetical protein
MSYNAIAAAAQDPNLRERIAACLAQETDGVEQPTALADLYMWRLAASPGWGEAYDYARDTRLLSNPVPVGADPAVITDAMILAAVQAVLAP